MTIQDDLKTQTLQGPRGNQRTDHFQKLLVVLLALQLVPPAESHGGDRGATESTEKTSGREKKQEWPEAVTVFPCVFRRRPTRLTSSFL